MEPLALSARLFTSATKSTKSATASLIFSFRSGARYSRRESVLLGSADCHNSRGTWISPCPKHNIASVNPDWLATDHLTESVTTSHKEAGYSSPCVQ